MSKIQLQSIDGHKFNNICHLILTLKFCHLIDIFIFNNQPESGDDADALRHEPDGHVLEEDDLDPDGQPEQLEWQAG